MFRGVTSINVDTKGRIVMPTRYRERLSTEYDGKLIITIDTEEKCLLIYPLLIWEEIETKLAALPSFNPMARRIQRLLIGHATEVDIDGQGRVLLPIPLREYAGLTKRSVIIGQGKKFELWDEMLWQQKCTEWLVEELVQIEQLPEEVKNLSL